MGLFDQGFPLIRQSEPNWDELEEEEHSVNGVSDEELDAFAFAFLDDLEPNELPIEPVKGMSAGCFACFSRPCGAMRSRALPTAEQEEYQRAAELKAKRAVRKRQDIEKPSISAAEEAPKHQKIALEVAGKASVAAEQKIKKKSALRRLPQVFKEFFGKKTLKERESGRQVKSVSFAPETHLKPFDEEESIVADFAIDDCYVAKLACIVFEVPQTNEAKTGCPVILSESVERFSEKVVEAQATPAISSGPEPAAATQCKPTAASVTPKNDTNDGMDWPRELARLDEVLAVLPSFGKNLPTRSTVSASASPRNDTLDPVKLAQELARVNEVIATLPGRDFLRPLPERKRKVNNFTPSDIKSFLPGTYKRRAAGSVPDLEPSPGLEKYLPKRSATVQATKAVNERERCQSNMSPSFKHCNGDCEKPKVSSRVKSTVAATTRSFSRVREWISRLEEKPMTRKSL